MANLPLTVRRALARGISPRVYRAHHGSGAILSNNASGAGNRASLTTALAGSNNDLKLIAKTPGTAGNSVTFRIVVSGNNTPLSVSVAGSAITVNSATNGSAAATSTAREVRRAINEDRTAGPLVWAQDAPGNDGSGVVAALGVTSLAGAS